jgi:hypothetical protein
VIDERSHARGKAVLAEAGRIVRSSGPRGANGKNSDGALQQTQVEQSGGSKFVKAQAFNLVGRKPARDHPWSD